MLLAGLAALFAAGGCIPYATGTTALPTPQGEVVPATSIYFIPGGVERLSADSTGGSSFGIDLEARFGLDGRSDLGVRAPGLLGIVVNYKRRIDRRLDEDGPAVAWMLGAGVVNAGEHAHVEASLLTSGRQSDDGAGFTPYGGIKAMHVFPLVPEAVRDDPTLGAFAGIRIGTAALAVSPEIAVFYDRSALQLRDRNWIIVPSFTFHGDNLVRALFGGRPDTRPPPGYPPRPWP
ncbi:MAG: hypothetical protein KY467_16485 [Gemmatimonadetes bacterium]|nr:hypothetical protein [Gemmatimonadota bacterium]